MDDAQARQLTDAAAVEAAVIALVDGARNELCVLSAALDAHYYGAVALTDVLQHFLLRSPRVRLQILVAEPRAAAAQRGLPLLELGRRLSSRVAFRELADDQPRPLRQEWWIGDGRHLVERALHPAGTVSLDWADAPQRARQQRDAFTALWETSAPSSWLRALHL